ncbi:NAD-dependent epimerase/dehydratase family protein [Streptomyces sp. H-KF8]|uniref:NAD-dependent epimerase/dehydratase family protein n=1 Tax=Streptomyces sp. H-KF8 TaxID=1727216 RepID=UPI000AA5307F|nr:NAD-dependent epimerase/dehydratase family protein [Streptomyces sp. H-KF8]
MTARPGGDGRPLVVVLGASGFIGSPLTRALAGRPVRLRLVARRATPVPDGALAETEVRTTDLAAPGAIAEAVEGPTPSSTWSRPPRRAGGSPRTTPPPNG